MGLQDVLERTLERARLVLVRPAVQGFPPWVTPNGLVWARLAGAGVLAGFLLAGEILAAFVTYLLALATDALDGELARVRGAVSRLGARLDASIDKILHAVAFFAFLPAEPVLILAILVLDALLLVLGLVLVAFPRSRGLDVTASAFGKWKLFCQAAALLLLFASALVSFSLPRPLLRLLLGLALVLGTLSFLEYARRVPQLRGRG